MERKEYKLLNIIRIPAFLSVFLFHATIIGEEAKWSISFFLVLSGFLNTLHGYNRRTDLNPRQLVHYGIKKIRNLYPLHVVMTFVAFLLYVMSVRSEISADVASFAAGSLVKLITNLILISDWGPKVGVFIRIFSEYNIAAWYLSLCFLLFILTPVFLRIMHVLYKGNDESDMFVVKPMLVSLILFAAAVLCNYFFLGEFGGNEATVFIYENPLTRMWEYLIAMQAGYIFNVADRKSDYEMCSYRKSMNKNRAGISCIKWYVITLLVSIGTLIYELIITNKLDGESIWVASSGFYFVIPVVFVVYFAARVEGLWSYRNSIAIQNYGAEQTDNSVVNRLSKAAGLVQYAFLIHVPVINMAHAFYKRVAEVNTLVWCGISFAITILLAYLVSLTRKNTRMNS